MMKPRLVFLALLGFAAPATAQNVAHETTVSTDAALQIATAALAQCRADGQKVTVSVVDHVGTAVTYKMASADYGARVKELRGIGPVLLPNITTAAGGVPIRAGDRVIGAVGISGTPGSAGRGEHDAKCAAAGIAKVKF